MDDNDIIELFRIFAHRNDPDRVIDAEQALLSFCEDGIIALIEALGDPDADLRLPALQLLEHVDGDTESALPVMIEALDDPDRTVRISALAPVSKQGAKAMDAVPILKKWIGIDDEFSQSRRQA
jgi:HEAT repeat protein